MLSKAQIQLTQRLQQKKFRLSESLFLVEGTKIVAELLNTQHPIYCIYALREWVENNEHHANFPADKVICVTAAELKKMSSLNTPNEVIALLPLSYKDYSKDLLASQLCLLLDDLQDPGNFGTIIRIADWFGIKTIFCTENTVDVFNPKVIQASMGSFLRVNIVYHDAVEVIKDAAQLNVQTFAAALGGSNMYETKLPKNALLVLGNESKGISDSLLKLINNKIQIPSFAEHVVDSLNVSIAAAILCAEFRR